MRAQLIHHIADQGGQIDALLAQRKLPGICHGKRVQITHQATQMFNLRQQHMHLCRRGVDHAVTYRMQAGLKHRQGRAQFMRDGRGSGQSLGLQ